MLKNFGMYIKLLKAVIKGKAEVKKTMEQNGWKSTRFWMVVTTMALNVFGALMGMLPAATVAWIIFWLAVAYLILRTISKFTPTTKDDELVQALEDPLRKLGIDTSSDKVPAPPKEDPVPGHE